MAPGDIVRHAECPNWGRGYVIRATKTSADIFFQWGGKQKIDAGEPLDPSRVSGVEAELFSLCASLSARSWSRGHHSVYAIRARSRRVEEPRLPRAQSWRRGGRMLVHRGDRTDTRRAVRAAPDGNAVRTLRPRSWPQAQARPGGRVLAPAVPDCCLYGTKTRRMVTGTGVRGLAELTRPRSDGLFLSQRAHGIDLRCTRSGNPRR